MTFDVFELLDKGLATFIAVIFILGIVATWKILTKHIPKLLEAGKEFVGVWRDFVDAVEDNSKAVEKNTDITDANNVEVKFNTAPTSGQYRVIVIG